MDLHYCIGCADKVNPVGHDAIPVHAKVRSKDMGSTLERVDIQQGEPEYVHPDCFNPREHVRA